MDYFPRQLLPVYIPTSSAEGLRFFHIHDFSPLKKKVIKSHPNGHEVVSHCGF